MTDKTESTLKDADIHSLQKQWDVILCPICMEHPHNAVVLICTSYEKGCRSYICDTSYKHSNCLDRFRKLRISSGDNTSGSSSTITENVDAERRSLYGADPPPSPHPATTIAIANAVEAHDNFSIDGAISAELDEFFDNPELRQAQDGYQASHSEGNMSSDGFSGGNEPEANCLKCPLCRGAVLGWMIVKEARQYMDLKFRSCSRESCSFSGNYKDLRKHAQRIHPMTRPAEVDPSRQQPGAVVLGDYVIDEGDGLQVMGVGRGGLHSFCFICLEVH